MNDVPAPPRECPDPSILAAFVEGTLDPCARHEVEQHVADCSECAVVIAETVDFLQQETDETEDEPEPQSRHPWRWFAAAAALAALCVGGIWRVAANRDPLKRVQQIVARDGARPIEGQLAGFDYAPFAQLRSDRKATNRLALKAEIERMAESGRADPSALHARGVATLWAGDVAAAMALLETASRRAPLDATILNDLAAAYVAAGTVGSRTQFTKAVDAAARANALAPSLGASHFNRAVALERLGRRDDAVHAYQRALELESRVRWRNEVTSRIARLKL